LPLPEPPEQNQTIAIASLLHSDASLFGYHFCQAVRWPLKAACDSFEVSDPIPIELVMRRPHVYETQTVSSSHKQQRQYPYGLCP
jgi:hypothetical protein